MNLPNKLTVGRIICAPIFYGIFLFSLTEKALPFQLLLALGLCIFWLILEITDVFDGHIARKQGLVSNLGKLMDPFSDVLSRLTFFYCFAMAGIYPFWPILIIFWRELSVTFVRAVLAQTGVTLAAGNSGKIKAVFYFVASAYGMLAYTLESADILSQNQLSCLFYIADFIFVITMVISVLSFIPYLIGFLKTDYMQKHIKE